MGWGQRGVSLVTSSWGWVLSTAEVHRAEAQACAHLQRGICRGFPSNRRGEGMEGADEIEITGAAL